VGWSAVGLGAAWFDRLTRGYMSGGLRLAAAALAAAVLAAALLV
jgi:cell division protein FtsX